MVAWSLAAVKLALQIYMFLALQIYLFLALQIYMFLALQIYLFLALQIFIFHFFRRKYDPSQLELGASSSTAAAKIFSAI